MNLTKEEVAMYKVMKSIYDSNIPISFKGSMVLKAYLMEAGYNDDTRHTVDIDANWNLVAPPSERYMVDTLQTAIDKSGLNLRVKLSRSPREKRSAGFKLIDPTKDEETTLFTMDVDVNRPVSPTKIYEVEGLRFCGVAPLQMIADKTVAISTDKVFRRIKDVVDLHYMSKIFEFNTEDVLQTIKNSERTLESFDGFLYKTEDLKHAYDKFRFNGEVNKPPFEEVYENVKAYIKDLLPDK